MLDLTRSSTERQVVVVRYTSRENLAINELLKELNETENVFPNIELKMIFHSYAQPNQESLHFPPDQEVWI